MSAAWYRREVQPSQEGRKEVESGIHFDNSGDGPLRVPGFGDYPVDLERPPVERFAHGAQDWAQPRLTARELAMLRVMNQLTDLPGWHVAVLDDDNVAGLRPNPVAAPLISDLAWSWCVAELRDKAARFRTDRFVSVFDAGSAGVVKSDALISQRLLDRFQTRMGPLIAEVEAKRAKQNPPPQHDRATSPDMEEFVKTLENLIGGGPSSPPRSYGVPRPCKEPLKLIDPSQYPLVYGRTKVLTGGGRVELDDTLKTIGRGEIAPLQPWGGLPIPQQVSEDWNILTGRPSSWHRPEDAAPYLYSHRLQWLPCEVSFLDGKAGSTEVKITSYINNLHPIFHRSLYSAIEEVISLSIKPWNEVLVRTDAYHKPRIRTYGVECHPPYPDWAWDLPELDEKRSLVYSYHDGTFPNLDFDVDEFLAIYAAAKEKVTRVIGLPDPVRESPLSHLDVHLSGRRASLQKAMQKKYHSIRTSWQHPEPGVSYTFDDWKAGRADCAVIPPVGYRRDNMADEPEFSLPVQPVSLQDDFRKEGLQVIVRLTSIELEPDTMAPLNRENWRDDGISNEHIVATTIVCLSSVNLRPYSMYLQAEADLEGRYFHYLNGELEGLEKVFEFTHNERLGGEGSHRTAALQRLGRVYLPEGRLLAVPSVLHRLCDAPPQLADPTKPGRLQILVLHLVDPHYRICSTRNVPPQQHSWWAAAAGLGRLMGQTKGSRQGGLPPEVADQIAREVGTWPMGDDEASEIEKARVDDEDLYAAAVRAGWSHYTFAFE